MKIKELYNTYSSLDGQEISVNGWVRNMRDSKVFGFIELNDGSYFKNVQVVFEEDKISNFAEICRLNIGSSLRVTGTLVVTPDAKQPFEIKATEILVEGTSTPEYPLQPKRHSMEFLRTIPHLRASGPTCPHC